MISKQIRHATLGLVPYRVSTRRQTPDVCLAYGETDCLQKNNYQEDKCRKEVRGVSQQFDSTSTQWIGDVVTGEITTW